jgi:quercetin dioxygenase-like cupin family protein
MYLGNIYNKPATDKIKLEKVYSEDRFHIMLLQLKEGELLKPHHASTDAFLLVAEGEIIFILKEKEFHLKKGDMLTFKSMETHSVQAVKDATVLITK